MKLTSENLKNLHELYINHLEKALDMEQKITKALPAMIDKSSSPDLASALRSHLQETEGHVQKVEQLLQRHIGKSKSSTCKAIAGLITQAEDGMKDAKDPEVRDATIIASAQEVEHHEMAVYGTLRTWAQTMKHTEDVQTLESILKEEKAADEKLSALAGPSNTRAAA
jgi:ferritin-like metal-binding protein YciE